MKYPKVNYIGNKEKLSKWIVDNFPVSDGIVVDMFAGGGSVSYELKKRGYTVLSNDSLFSSYVVLKSIIENSFTKFDLKNLEIYLELPEIEEKYNNVSWLVNRLFFDFEVLELARLLVIIDKLNGYEKHFLQALLRRAMIRKLPYSRMNIDWKNITKLRNEEYSYSKYKRKRAYHNKPFFEHIKENINDYNNSIFDNGKRNLVSQKDVFDFLEELVSADVIYLDPPYPGTMNKYESFYGIFDVLFNKNIVQTDFTKSQNFLIDFKLLIRRCLEKSNFVVISLNSRVNPPLDQIMETISEYGKIKCITQNHSYKLTSSLNKNNSKEILLIIERGDFFGKKEDNCESDV
jgi:adenine-specific DNA-methyltransferase